MVDIIDVIALRVLAFCGIILLLLAFHALYIIIKNLILIFMEPELKQDKQFMASMVRNVFLSVFLPILSALMYFFGYTPFTRENAARLEKFTQTEHVISWVVPVLIIIGGLVLSMIIVKRSENEDKEEFELPEQI